MSDGGIDIALRLKDQATRDMGKTLGLLRTQADGLRSAFSGVGAVLGGLGVGVGAAGFLEFLTSSVAEAREAERATAKLASVLRSTGGAAGLTATQLKDYADQVQAATGIENDLVVNAEAVLATFRSVGGEVFPRAISAAADLSAVFGQDLQKSTVQLGKALEDPVKGMNALRRVGVMFSETQQAQIKRLVEHNRLLEAQKLILGEVETQVGGAAAAMQGPLSKALADSGLAWKDFKESVGNLMPIETGLHGIAAALRGVTAALKEMDKTPIQDLRAWSMGVQAGAPKAAAPVASPFKALTWSEALSKGDVAARGPFYSAPPDEWGSSWTWRSGHPERAGKAGRPAPSFFSAPEGLWGSPTAWQDRKAAAEVGARLRASAALARSGGFSVGTSAAAVIAYWDAQAEAVAASEEAAAAASSGGLERYRWKMQAEQARAGGKLGQGYNAFAVASYWDEMAAGAEGGGKGYNAFAVASYWDEMSASADKALDADKVQAYTAAFSELGGVLQGTSSLLLQFYEAGGRESRKLFEFYKGVAIAETVIATAQGIMNVWAGPLGKYPPAAGAFSVAVGALGAAKVGLIAAQQPPALAEGGIVTRPTYALIGEAGPEAVIPLSRGGGVGATYVTVNVPVQGSLDERLVPLVHTLVRDATRQGLAEAARDNRAFRGTVRRMASGRG